MPRTIRTAALLLTLPLLIASCRLYEHARRSMVHAIVTRSISALRPLPQSTYRPAPLTETITVTAKAPLVDEVPPAVARPLPIARTLASIGDAPGVNVCPLTARSLDILRLAELVRAKAELAHCRIEIEKDHHVIIIESSSL